MKNLNRVVYLNKLINDPFLKYINAVTVPAHQLMIALLAACTAEIQARLPQETVDGLTADEAEKAGRRDGKIPAIKAVRERWAKEGKNSENGYGLREAKELVENWMRKHLGFTCFPAQ